MCEVGNERWRGTRKDGFGQFKKKGALGKGAGRSFFFFFVVVVV
jgi:hypothetical protein